MASRGKTPRGLYDDPNSVAALRTALSLRGVASYVPETSLSGYDRKNNFYNLKASNTRKLRRGLGRAQAAAGLSHHVFIGDSETSYYTGTGADKAGMWPMIYRATLASLGIPVGGTGACPAGDSGPGPLDPRWTYTGTWSNNNEYRSISSSGQTATFTSDVAGTTVDLVTFGTSTSFNVTIDGGAPATVTPTGGLAPYHYTVTGLPNTTHTVVITTTSTSATYIIACNVSGTTGLVCHNLGRYGSTVAGGSGWAASTSGVGINATRIGSLPSGITPDMVWISLGVNDKGNSSTDATVVAALTTLRNQFPNSDVALVAQYQPGGISATTWNTYVASLYTLADTLNVPLLDLYDRSGGYTLANANGLMGDATHPNAAAQRDWGRAAALGVI